MGYRLSVEVVGNDNPSYYGTKLYGYVDEKELKSYKWLMYKGYLRADEDYCWDYGSENPIVMKIEDFRIFAIFYNIDCNENKPEYAKDAFIDDPDIQSFLKLDDDQLIVISWY